MSAPRLHLDLRAPGAVLPLQALLARAASAPFFSKGSVDALRIALEETVASAGARIDGRSERRLDAEVAAGARVECPLPRGAEVAQAEGSVAASAIVLAPAWERGELPLEGQRTLAFEVRERRGALSRIALRPTDRLPLDVLPTLTALASAGLPVLGDVLHGGAAIAEGLRWAGADAELDWPQEPTLPGVDARWPAAEPPVMEISRAAARALGRGHPWVLRDDESDPPERFAPGTLVALASRGRGCGLALVDPGPQLSARVYAAEATRPREAASIEARVARALARRKPLLQDPARTDAFRLVHAEADELPGVVVDRLGPALRVLWRGRALGGFADRLLDALSHGVGEALPILEVVHLERPPKGRFERVRWRRGTFETSERLPDGRPAWEVCERGLRFLVEPGVGQPERSSPGVGLYLDQRENRERLASGAADRRWLNLFAHTGAFSVALLAAGARRVVSVDLGAPVLRWLDRNLTLNADVLDLRRHESRRADGRHFLDGLPRGERFDGMVIDPPTTAAGGGGRWTVARGLEPLLVSAFARLEPGGELFVSRNDRRGARGFEALVTRAAEHAGVPLERIEEVGPGVDFPIRRGHPEGMPFAAVRAWRR